MGLSSPTQLTNTILNAFRFSLSDVCIITSNDGPNLQMDDYVVKISSRN